MNRALLAAADIEKRDPRANIEVIDLRSLAPIDWETIFTSVRKTSRLLVVHEDTLTHGFGAEIAARAAAELFTDLDAPIGRLAALDTWVGYNPGLESEILPQVSDLIREAERLLRY